MPREPENCVFTRVCGSLYSVSSNATLVPMNNFPVEKKPRNCRFNCGNSTGWRWRRTETISSEDIHFQRVSWGEHRDFLLNVARLLCATNFWKFKTEQEVQGRDAGACNRCRLAMMKKGPERGCEVRTGTRMKVRRIGRIALVVYFFHTAAAMRNFRLARCDDG